MGGFRVAPVGPKCPPFAGTIEFRQHQGTLNNTKLKKTDVCVQVASILAKKALEKKISHVYFDRGRYKYHGRIKIFADTLRKNGLIF